MDNKWIILNLDNKIVNFIVWNGDLSIWQPPENCTAIQINSYEEIAQYEWAEINA